jgi:hypothetical protein
MVNKAESSLLFLWRSHSSGDKQKSNDKHGKPNGGKYQKKNKADQKAEEWWRNVVLERITREVLSGEVLFEHPDLMDTMLMPREDVLEHRRKPMHRPKDGGRPGAQGL